MQGQEAADGVASLRTELRLLRKDFTDVASSQRNLVDLGNQLGYHIAGLRRDVRRGLADVAAAIRGKEEEAEGEDSDEPEWEWNGGWDAYVDSEAEEASGDEADDEEEGEEGSEPEGRAVSEEADDPKEKEEEEEAAAESSSTTRVKRKARASASPESRRPEKRSKPSAETVEDSDRAESPVA